MKTTKSCPVWARELVTQVCKDYKRALPKKLQWYNRRAGQWTSGFTSYSGDKIHISAGSSGYDQELVLLHELAHHIPRIHRQRRKGHTIKFWRLAFELYERYGIDLDYAIYREEEYRKKATWAYKEQLAKK